MKKISILIVDDEENVSRLISKVLSKEGFKTHVSNSAEDALKKIDENEIDIVISDIKMPGMSGIELLAKIRELDGSIRVILITAFATLETAIEALRNGASDYITKPFDIDEILLSVKKLVEDDEDIRNISLQSKNIDDKLEGYLNSKSLAMRNAIDLIKQVANTRATVMIFGETGTGKELAAQSLHALSSRKAMPFIKVNCTAIPENLLESELFGYEKGAFTGAVTTKPGKFELAQGGSIFLDEIGDISLAIQAKLLRVIQEREIEHLGGTKTLKVDVRIITATNRDLEKLVREGQFREDLYYRLNVVPVQLPPLRDRKEDIESLVQSFLVKSSAISGRPVKKIDSNALEKLVQYNWPGNIRELENIIERCVVITSKECIELQDLPKNIRNFVCNDEYEEIASATLDDAIDNAERAVIIKTLKECNGNRTKAAEVLGISRRSLHRKIIRYNID